MSAQRVPASRAASTPSAATSLRPRAANPSSTETTAAWSPARAVGSVRSTMIGRPSKKSLDAAIWRSSAANQTGSGNSGARISAMKLRPRTRMAGS